MNFLTKTIALMGLLKSSHHERTKFALGLCHHATRKSRSPLRAFMSFAAKIFPSSAQLCPLIFFAAAVPSLLPRP
jgi:hypothetical protein